MRDSAHEAVAAFHRIPDRSPDDVYFFDVTLLGACGAGKTSLVFRFMGDDFDSARRPSPGLPKTTHAIVLDRQLIYLNFFVSQKMGEQTAAEGFGVAALLWGTEVATAGARASEASLSEATMVLFDAQDPVALADADEWLRELRGFEEKWPKVRALVATRGDSLAPGETLDEAKRIAQSHQAELYVTDSRSGLNVQTAIEDFVRKVPKTEFARRRSETFTYHEPHYYHDPPVSYPNMESRLAPARAVAGLGMPVILWAEDVLALTQFVPTALIALEILVPDDQVSRAAGAIEALGYVAQPAAEIESRKRLRVLDRRPVSIFDPSTRYLRLAGLSLQDASEQCVWGGADAQALEILVHPASAYHLGFDDPDRLVPISPPLDPSNANIFAPSRGALLDSFVESLLEPGGLESAPRPFNDHIHTYLSYMITYSCRESLALDEEGFFSAPMRQMLDEMRPENRPFFETMALQRSSPWATGRAAQRRERQELLERRLRSSQALPEARQGLLSTHLRPSPSPSTPVPTQGLVRSFCTLPPPAPRYRPMRPPSFVKHLFRRL